MAASSSTPPVPADKPSSPAPSAEDPQQVFGWADSISGGTGGKKGKAKKGGEKDKVSELGLRVEDAPVIARTANQRRTPDLVKIVIALIGVVLALFACYTAALYRYYQDNIAPQLQSLAIAVQVKNPPAELSQSQALASTRTELLSTQSDLAKARDQIQMLQKQLRTLQEKQETDAQHLAQFAERVQQSLANGEGKGDGKPASAAATGIGASTQIASVVPVASPVNQELWLLKERTRLTFWADDAISNGSSEAMANLWRSLSDPELTRLRDGVQAEIIRVQNYYRTLSRLPPDFRLPVRDLFKSDTSIRSEADLEPAQAIKLLLDLKQPMEVRARAAYVLGGRRSREVAQALIQAMKNDPSLDVVKEAQRTLEDDYGMKIPPLHSRAAEEWWKAGVVTDKKQ